MCIRLLNFFGVAFLIYACPWSGFAQQTVSNKPELVFVDGGNFLMGCSSTRRADCVSDEFPVVNVSVYDFWIGKYEVTNAQYAEFLTRAGNKMEGGQPWHQLNQYSLIEELEPGIFSARNGFESYPVSNVSWFGAKAYTDWLTTQTGDFYRLPTEAEWEYAARGGRQSQGFLYSGSDNPDEVAWSNEFAENSGTGWEFKKDKGTHPVGQKSPNELGIHDMSGNLSEWCGNFYQNFHEGGVDPTGPTTGSLRVLRGGSWDNKSAGCRVSARNFAQHTGRFSVNKGFRVVREKDISKPINSFATENDFNGTILVKRKNRIIYSGSFGLADRENNIPITAETKFPIASITKIFTSVIVLQLVEEGKLDLNKTISSYIPAYTGPARDQVTIHQLLTHTSGLQRSEEVLSVENRIPAIYQDDVSTDELLGKYCCGKLVAEPGTTFNYSNGEYIILGKIIEAVSNENYDDVLMKRILEPLGLKNSGLLTQTHSVENLAQGYKWDQESRQFKKDPARLIRNYFTGGGMYSTAGDLAKFADALYMHKKLLDEQSLNLLLQTYPESREYGYGLWVRYPQYNQTVAHAAIRYGRIWGINTLVSRLLDHETTIIVLANTDKLYVDDFQGLIGELILN